MNIPTLDPAQPVQGGHARPGQQIGTEITGKKHQTLVRQFIRRGCHVLEQPVSETVKNTADVIIACQRVYGGFTVSVNLDNASAQFLQQEKQQSPLIQQNQFLLIPKKALKHAGKIGSGGDVCTDRGQVFIETKLIKMANHVLFCAEMAVIGG